MARRKHTTYRSEFASLSPLQQEHNLSLLRRLLAVFFNHSGQDLTAPSDDVRQHPLGRRPVTRRRCSK